MTGSDAREADLATMGMMAAKNSGRTMGFSEREGITKKAAPEPDKQKEPPPTRALSLYDIALDVEKRKVWRQ